MYILLNLYYITISYMILLMQHYISYYLICILCIYKYIKDCLQQEYLIRD